MWFVYALLAVFVGGHLLSAVTEKEHWPFGPYLMFSQANSSQHVGLLRMMGVTDEAAPREILLSKDPAYFAPMPVYHIRLAFYRAVWQWSGGQPELLETLSRDYLNRYEARREAGLHQGPRLSGLRLYRYDWTTHPDAGNAAKPDRVTLIYDTQHPDWTQHAHSNR